MRQLFSSSNDCLTGLQDGTDYLSWRHNGVQIVRSITAGRYPERYDILERQGLLGEFNLQIQNVTKNDEGVFECVYLNRYTNNIGVNRLTATGQLTVVPRSGKFQLESFKQAK